MEHDPILKDIDAEYVEASAEAFRLGRRSRVARQPAADGQASLLARLQNPELRTTRTSQVSDEPVPVQRR